MFTSQLGSTMDTYARTLTTFIASMRKARSYTAIEKNEVCFKLSMARLRLLFCPLLSAKSEEKGLKTQFKDQNTVSSDLTSDIYAQIAPVTSNNSNTITPCNSPGLNGNMRPLDDLHAHSGNCEDLPSAVDGTIESIVHMSDI